MFDYKGCTVEELADHVEASNSQLITTTMIYYRNRGVDEMVEKINAARLIVKKRKLMRQLEQM